MPTKPTAKRCPECGLPNPWSATRCRCGNDFPAASEGHPEVVPASSPQSGKSIPSGVNSSSKAAPKWSAANIVGGVIGAAVGRYSGFSLLIPLAGTVAAWVIGSKVITGTGRHFIPAISVQVGHMVWFLLGLFALGAGGLSQVGIDIVLMTIGLLWLVVRPGVWPVGLLSSWQVLALLVNIEAISEATVNSNEHKALVVHVAFRTIALYFMVVGLIALRRQDPATFSAA